MKRTLFNIDIALIILFFLAGFCDDGLGQLVNDGMNNRNYCFLDNAKVSIDKYIYPFDFDSVYINSKTLKNICEEDVIMDSIFQKGWADKFILKNNNSEVEIYRKFHDGRYYSYLGDFKMKSNVFIVEEGIKIGMDKYDFYDRINIKPFDCDTVHIHPFNSAADFYFIFRQATLESIEKAYRVY